MLAANSIIRLTTQQRVGFFRRRKKLTRQDRAIYEGIWTPLETIVGSLLQTLLNFGSLMQCQRLTQIGGQFNIPFMPLILHTEPSCELISMFIWHQEVLLMQKTKYWPLILYLQKVYCVIYIKKYLVVLFQDLTIQTRARIFGRATGNDSLIVLCTMKVVFHLKLVI